MKQIVTVLVGIACVVVIAASGLWMWQQWQRSHPGAGLAVEITGTQCAGYIETLQRDAANPGSVTAEEKEAATEGRVACLDQGIN